MKYASHSVLGISIFAEVIYSERIYRGPSHACLNIHWGLQEKSFRLKISHYIPLYVFLKSTLPCLILYKHHRLSYPWNYSHLKYNEVPLLCPCLLFLPWSIIVPNALSYPPCSSEHDTIAYSLFIFLSSAEWKIPFPCRIWMHLKPLLPI